MAHNNGQNNVPNNGNNSNGNSNAFIGPARGKLCCKSTTFWQSLRVCVCEYLPWGVFIWATVCSCFRVATTKFDACQIERKYLQVASVRKIQSELKRSQVAK